MIHITEDQLKAAIQICLGGDSIYTEQREAKLVHDIKALSMADVSGSLLKSLHQDLKGFQEMGFLTPDAKSGLGIAIEQVERYMRMCF